MDFTDTDPLADGSGAVASWHCDAALWRDFRLSELLPYTNSSRAGMHMLIGSLAVCFVLLTAIGVTSAAGLRTWSGNIGPAIIVIVISSIFAISGLIIFVSRRSRDLAMATETGEVAIDHDGLSINGIRHDWVFYGEGWRLISCTRRSVPGADGSSFEILDFYCKTKVRTPRATIPADVNWRVPVPPDKLLQADLIADRLNTRCNNTA